MPVGRKQRRTARVERVQQRFDAGDVEPALDLLEVLELAWHDCYGEISPSEEIVDDVLLLSGGELSALIGAVRLATTDWRDLKVAADAIRAREAS